MNTKQIEDLLQKRRQEYDAFLSANEGKMFSLHPNADALCEIASDAMSDIRSLEEELAEALREEEEAGDERLEAIRIGEEGYAYVV